MTRLLWIVLFSSMLFSGCDKKEEYEGPNSGWDNHTVVALSFFVDDRGEHGFICAPHDQSAGVPRHKGSNLVTDPTSRDYGDGKANADKIIAAQVEGVYAAKWCKNLVLNGYSDWNLPSMSEAFRMYFNLHSVNEIGDFADGEKY